MNQPVTTVPVISTQSSVDTKTHLQLFQTMLNIQPFNSELAFLARNIKVKLIFYYDPINGELEQTGEYH
jgi:hypothetical protein